MDVHYTITVLETTMKGRQKNGTHWFIANCFCFRPSSIYLGRFSEKRSLLNMKEGDEEDARLD